MNESYVARETKNEWFYPGEHFLYDHETSCPPNNRYNNDLCSETPRRKSYSTRAEAATLPWYAETRSKGRCILSTQCKNQIDTRGNGSTTKKDPANGLNPDLFVSKPSYPFPNSDALPVKFWN